MSASPRLVLWPVLLLLLIVAGPSSSSGQEAARADESLAPGEPSVLIVNQETPDWPMADDQIGRQVEMLLRHFTPNTETISAGEYADDQLFDYDRVVVIGNDAVKPLPSGLLEDVAEAGRPVLWLGHGLDRLPVDLTSSFGFSLEPAVLEGPPDWVEYKGERHPAEGVDYGYHRVYTAKPSSARVLATYGTGGTSIPYIVRGGDLWYVNGLPTINTDYPDPKLDGPVLIFADALHDFFGTSVDESREAVIRLEDVSVHVDPDRIVEVADYLYKRHVPFAIGVIPAQRLEDGSVVALGERPKFVRALRYAQDRGGTIILHGYHHTFGTGEDYEYWDEVRDAPLRGETWDKYAFKMEDGIRLLRDQGLEPRFWETPHYAASPLAYRVFSRYFSHAIENRRTGDWMPYPAGPDEYGQMLVPENIGYINPDEGYTVDAQLRHAEALKIVRDSWAVGFYHPASIRLSELKSLVEGLQRQGYSFADLRALPTEVRYDYRPGPLTRVVTWVKVDLGLDLMALDKGLEVWSAWWPTVRSIPWLTLLITVMMTVFLVRLRMQWRPSETVASSLVESVSGARHTTSRVWPLAIIVCGTALAVGVLLLGREGSSADDPGSNPLRGWSSLDWTVEYDGYGEVGVEDGAAVLSPRRADRPAVTHAALALAGDPGLRDYSFEVRMRFQEQLRQNSPPNTWETGWLFFRYTAEDRSYYLAHKTNGLELGKLVPPKGTGQVYLVTKSHPPAEPGRWYNYRIEVEGPRIRVYLDDKLQIDYTDPNPIRSGRVGLYTEDARVQFREPTVTGRPPAGS